MADNTFMGTPIDKLTLSDKDVCFVLYFDPVEVSLPALQDMYNVATKTLPLPVVAFPRDNILKLMNREDLVFLRNRVDDMIKQYDEEVIA